ncbi:MAG: hypothetical protein GX410_10150 [Elusimicrobia bacterium]|nr:hypothetical protein [Elusimicrobiota bacterium]
MNMEVVAVQYTESNPANPGAAAPDTVAQFLHKAKKATPRRFRVEKYQPKILF